MYCHEEVCERLSSAKFKTHLATNPLAGKVVLVRSLSLIGGETLLQLEIALSLINRSAPKPIATYIDSSTLKLIYGYFKGCVLTVKRKTSEMHEQQELKLFVVRMLFLLHDLESMKIELSGLSSDIILLKDAELSNPIILNFSSAQRK